MVVKQRVNGVVIRTLYKLYQLFGYNLVYYSLYLVVLYYFLFAHNVRRALKIYYSRIGLKFTNRRYFKHLFYYAVTTTDRFISKSNPESFTLEYEDRPKLVEEIKNGSILLLTHFGGWATASHYFNEEGIVLNVVMNEAMIASAAAFEDILDKKNQDFSRIINISKNSIASSISIANALSNNESVAMMGDRATHPKYQRPMEFFGKQACFNDSPFLIAYKTRKSVVLFSVKLVAKRQYKTSYHIINLDYSLPQEESIQDAMNQYVAFISERINDAPLQWFNFYDFWNTHDLHQ